MIPAAKKRIWKSTNGSTERSPNFAAAEAEAHEAANKMPSKRSLRFNVQVLFAYQM